jgi:4-diphosphocytidyl-2-C-methyl-D-erythritol kinase
MSPPARRSVRVRACAKVNLTLRVLGIRSDGYHELRTTFQSLALHDTLTFTSRRGPFAITSNDPQCPPDKSNLVWQAAERLWEAAGRTGEVRGVQVRITKRIPTQAGLGGGSSDAAAALRALSVLWKLRASDGLFQELARGLGADVAFFLEGGTVLGIERGDLLFPLQDAPAAWVVVARPDFGVSTKEAYAWWDEAWQAGRSNAARNGARTNERVNDLQPLVVARHPSIGTLLRQLERGGASFAAMSGSGSAVFGLFDRRAPAHAAALKLSGRPDVRTWLTQTANRRQYLRVSAPRLSV